jgi:adenosine deaminase
MEDLDLGLEYQRVAEAYGLDAGVMGQLALEGIESTWLDESERRDLRQQFQRELQEAMA